MNELRLTRAIADEMVAHCMAERPNEGCGLIATANGEAVKVFRITNVQASPLRYAMKGEEQLAADTKMREEGWELGGIFHSHTRTEAYPSPTDVRDAVEDVPYIIVSLAEEPPSIRAFRILKEELGDEKGEIREISVVVEG
ncbi:MAG TPA: M67 family metallopeptidase [Actinomycetota bacterium]|nr:M67 family metallopeptidase [Actinomycetota bacterium]